MKFQPSKFDKIIFDMDGVITGEYIYWDTAALTVYELLLSYKQFGRSEIDREWCRDNYKELHRIIFSGDKTIKAVKNLGVNTNWDLAYIVFCVSRYIDPELNSLDEWHFESVRMFIENIEAKSPEVYDLVGGLAAVATGHDAEYFKRGNSEVWDRLHDCFQKWFHGDGEIKGLNELEEPILSIDKIKQTLEYLKDCGLKLGIGTGRPKDEIMFPINAWGLSEYFEPDMIVTYDEVLEAEKEVQPDKPLAKPDPFVFLKSAFGGTLSNSDIVQNKYHKNLVKQIAVVGDAPSDIMAAKAAKMPFIGVLTGVDRISAEKYFLSMNADYIFDDITGMMNN